MAFFGWFSKNKQKIKVAKRKSSILKDAATAAAFAEAGEHETAHRIVTPKKQTRKILVIGQEAGFSKELREYALDMAKRLSFELVALSVTNRPLGLSGAKREAAEETFTASAENNISAMQADAESNGIPFSHRIEIANQEEAVEKLHAEDAGLCYVLTEPDPEMVQSGSRVSIPVFNLDSYQSLAA